MSPRPSTIENIFSRITYTEIPAFALYLTIIYATISDIDKVQTNSTDCHLVLLQSLSNKNQSGIGEKFPKFFDIIGGKHQERTDYSFAMLALIIVSRIPAFLLKLPTELPLRFFEVLFEKITLDTYRYFFNQSQSLSLLVLKIILSPIILSVMLASGVAAIATKIASLVIRSILSPKDVLMGAKMMDSHYFSDGKIKPFEWTARIASPLLTAAVILFAPPLALPYLFAASPTILPIVTKTLSFVGKAALPVATAISSGIVWALRLTKKKAVNWLLAKPADQLTAVSSEKATRSAGIATSITSDASTVEANPSMTTSEDWVSLGDSYHRSRSFDSQVSELSQVSATHSQASAEDTHWTNLDPGSKPGMTGDVSTPEGGMDANSGSQSLISRGSNGSFSADSGEIFSRSNRSDMIEQYGFASNDSYSRSGSFDSQASELSQVSATHSRASAEDTHWTNLGSESNSGMTGDLRKSIGNQSFDEHSMHFSLSSHGFFSQSRGRSRSSSTIKPELWEAYKAGKPPMAGGGSRTSAPY